MRHPFALGTLLTLTTLTVATLGLAGCGLPDKDKAADKVARAVIGEVAAGSDLSRDTHVDPILRNPESTAELGGIRAMLSPGRPASTKNIEWNIASKPGEGSTAQLTYNYVYPDRTIRLQTVLSQAAGDGVWTVSGISAQRAGTADGPTVAGLQPGAPAGSD